MIAFSMAVFHHQLMQCNAMAVQVERGIDLVYGGGSIGLMGSVSHAVHAGGRHVMGLVSIAISPLPFLSGCPASCLLGAFVCGGLCMPWRSLVLGSARLGALFPGTNSLHQNGSLGCRNASFISSASQLLGSGCSIARWERGGKPCRLHSFHRSGSNFSVFFSKG